MKPKPDKTLKNLPGGGRPGPLQRLYRFGWPPTRPVRKVTTEFANPTPEHAGIPYDLIPARIRAYPLAIGLN